MGIFVGALNGSNLTRDSHVQAAISYILAKGVLKNFETELLVEEDIVRKGMAVVEATRDNITPNEKFLVPVRITADETIDTSGDGYIILRLNDSKVNDGSSNAADGSGVATVEKVVSLPSKNYIELASLSSGSITDSRTFSKLGTNATEQLAKADVGLGNVDNFITSTPASIAAQIVADIFSSSEFLTPQTAVQLINGVVGGTSASKTFGEAVDGTTTPKAMSIRDAVDPNSSINISTNNGYTGNIFSTRQQGQSFLMGSDKRVVGVILRAVKANSPTGNFILDLYEADANHYPTGSSLGTITTAVTSLPTSYTKTQFDLATPVEVTEGQRYVWVAKLPTDNNPHFVNLYGHNSDLYADGKGIESQNGGSSWTDINKDFDMEVITDTLASNKAVLAGGNDNAFVGFCSENVAADAVGNISYSGIISGFMGIEQGELYYLSASSDGTVSTTPNGQEIAIGWSDTEILIISEPKLLGKTSDIIQGSWTPSALNQTQTFSHSLGKVPEKIRFNAVQGNSQRMDTHGVWNNENQKCINVYTGGLQPDCVMSVTHSNEKIEVESVTDTQITLKKIGHYGSYNYAFIAELE